MGISALIRRPHNSRPSIMIPKPVKPDLGPQSSGHLPGSPWRRAAPLARPAAAAALSCPRRRGAAGRPSSLWQRQSPRAAPSKVACRGRDFRGPRRLVQCPCALCSMVGAGPAEGQMAHNLVLCSALPATARCQASKTPLQVVTQGTQASARVNQRRILLSDMHDVLRRIAICSVQKNCEG